MPGITPTGFEILRLDEIVEQMAARHRLDFGAAINTSPQSPLGQLDGALGEREASIWEFLQDVHNRLRLFGARGPALDDLAALVGLVRLPASATTVTVTLAGTPATVVPTGTQIRITGTDRVFELLAPATIGGGGTVDAIATATATGPIVARALSAWTIVTPVAGLSSVSNALDGTLGRDVELDSALRVRIIDTFTAPGNSVDALAAALYRVPNVTEVRIVENLAAYADGEGRPAHSFEAIVLGGTDAAVAGAIFLNKPGGIRAYGLTPVVVVASDGTAHTIGVTRPADVNVWIEVDITPRDGFPDDGATLIGDAIIASEDGIRSGQAFAAWEVIAAVAAAVDEDLIERVIVRIGTSPSPPTDSTIYVSSRQRAALDSSRISVTVL